MTQYETVLTHLKAHKSITSWDAITQYGITRLAAVICMLRKDGYRIETETVSKKKGERTMTFARYKLCDTK